MQDTRCSGCVVSSTSSNKRASDSQLVCSRWAMLQRGMCLVETLQPSYVAALPCANQMFTRLSWALALGPMHWCQLIPLRGVPGVVRFNVFAFFTNGSTSSFFGPASEISVCLQSARRKGNDGGLIPINSLLRLSKRWCSFCPCGWSRVAPRLR